MNNKPRKPSRKAQGKSKGRAALIITLIIAVAVVAGAIFGVGYLVKRMIEGPVTDTGDSYYTGTGEVTGDDTTSDGGDAPLERKDGVFNFLVLGQDKVGYNTDVLMIVNFDTSNGAASILQIPRDTYMRLNGVGHKINSNLARIRNQKVSEGVNKNVDKIALDEYCNLLQNSLNIKIDYYFMIDLVCFRNIVDHIGGVTVTLPNALEYDDPDQNLSIHLPAGTHTLNGVQAEGFIRFRSGYAMADIGRIDAQKIFMSALIRQIKENLTISTAVNIANELIKNVTTDIKLEDIPFFVSKVFDLDFSKVNMMTAHGTAYKNGMYYIMCRDTVYQMADKYFNVYETAIPEEYFDIDKVFTKPSDDQINSLYIVESPPLESFVKTMADINDKGIHIPMVPSKPSVIEPSDDTTAVVNPDPEPDTDNTDETDAADVTDAEITEPADTDNDPSEDVTPDAETTESKPSSPLFGLE